MSQTIAQRKTLRRYASHNGTKIVTEYASGKKDVQRATLAQRIGYLIGRIFRNAEHANMGSVATSHDAWNKRCGMADDSLRADCSGITVEFLDCEHIELN